MSCFETHCSVSGEPLTPNPSIWARILGRSGFSLQELFREKFADPREKCESVNESWIVCAFLDGLSVLLWMDRWLAGWMNAWMHACMNEWH